MQVSAEDAKCSGCREATEEQLLEQFDDVLKEYLDVEVPSPVDEPESAEGK